MSDSPESAEQANESTYSSGRNAGGSAEHPPDVPSENGVSEQTAPAKEIVLELRQIAGLTAGSVMQLHTGSFQFRESNKEVGFSLVVRSANDVAVLPGAASAMVDEIPVVDPTPLGSSILNVGSACFAVRPPRPPRDNGHLTELLEAARRPSKAVSVPMFSADSAAEPQAKSSRFGSLFSKSEDGEEPSLDADDWRFLESIRDARNVMAERHRNLHPNPEELRSRLDRLDPGLWDRTIEHPLFARFPVAYSTIPWEPRFDDPDRIPPVLHEPIQEMSILPWVPVTANLLFGPLAIVGSRSATLACARSAVLSLACLTSPTDIEFSIVTAQGLVEDWNWTSQLPNSLFPTGSNNYCVAVADGMTHFEGAGFDYDAVTNNEMGLIVLAESAAELPDNCGTILEITDDGHCRVTNHLQEQITGTPIGVTGDFAGATASIIREAVGDGNAEDRIDLVPSPTHREQEPDPELEPTDSSVDFSDISELLDESETDGSGDPEAESKDAEPGELVGQDQALEENANGEQHEDYEGQQDDGSGPADVDPEMPSNGDPATSEDHQQ